MSVEALARTIHAADQEALEHLRTGLASGKHWYVALLEAARRWGSPEERFQGRRFRHLLAGEAFDWLSLAERLALELDGRIPQDELEAFLFSGEPPIQLAKGQMRELMGPAKYRLHLNFFYGVVVEEALQLAVEEEVAKEYYAYCYPPSLDAEDGAFRRLYGDTRDNLFARFRGEKGLPVARVVSLAERREFTYWLFRLRCDLWERARVGADTKKGLEKLHEMRGIARRPSPK